MDFSIARKRMVEQQVKGRGVIDPLVLSAMLAIPRHRFVENALQSQAYSDFPLPIGEKQTISQPFMVAYMSAALQLKGGERVLEIGAGSGYQAAILAHIAARVYTVERHASLARRARKILDAIGCSGVNIRVCDGTFGWQDQAPFDAIVTTAGAPAIPDEYKRQLVVGGRLVIPVGDRNSQVLLRVTRESADQFREERLIDCRFVPLIGEQGWSGEED